jgi:hypothetical protein
MEALELMRLGTQELRTKKGRKKRIIMKKVKMKRSKTNTSLLVIISETFSTFFVCSFFSLNLNKHYSLSYHALAIKQVLDIPHLGCSYCYKDK